MNIRPPKEEGGDAGTVAENRALRREVRRMKRLLNALHFKGKPVLNYEILASEVDVEACAIMFARVFVEREVMASCLNVRQHRSFSVRSRVPTGPVFFFSRLARALFLPSFTLVQIVTNR